MNELIRCKKKFERMSDKFIWSSIFFDRSIDRKANRPHLSFIRIFELLNNLFETASALEDYSIIDWNYLIFEHEMFEFRIKFEYWLLAPFRCSNSKSIRQKFDYSNIFIRPQSYCKWCIRICYNNTKSKAMCRNIFKKRKIYKRNKQWTKNVLWNQGT